MNFFKLKENNTTVSTEIFAGLTTFMTMAYILIVNPNFLKVAGMNQQAVFMATAVSAFIGTMLMALLTNYPFALASGMGLNAFFAFSIASKYGWELALIAVFAEGLVFILLSAVSFREMIFDSIPTNLKHGVSVGIGLFITFIGLKSAGLVIDSPATTVAMGDIKDIRTILSFIGIILTIVLVHKRVKGALFWGILVTYILGVFCQITGLYVVDIDAQKFSLIPTNFETGKFAIISLPSWPKGFTLFDAFKSQPFKGESFFNSFKIIFPVLVALLFVDIFDTIGTLVGVSTKAGYLDKNNKLPKLKNALLADAIGTTVGAVVGTSTVTTYVESAAGVAEGGRTGLTGVVTACMFLIAMFFSPIFSAIPAFATAPALITVGLFMFQSVTKIELDDYTEAFPAFITLIAMPLTYSISDGLAIGFISYILIKLFSGKTKDVSIFMYILGIMFVLCMWFL